MVVIFLWYVPRFSIVSKRKLSTYRHFEIISYLLINHSCSWTLFLNNILFYYQVFSLSFLVPIYALATWCYLFNNWKHSCVFSILSTIYNLYHIHIWNKIQVFELVFYLHSRILLESFLFLNLPTKRPLSYRLEFHQSIKKANTVTYLVDTISYLWVKYFFRIDTRLISEENG